MKFPRSKFRHLAIGAAAFAAASIAVLGVSDPTASSQAARTIKIVVPIPPGGAGDMQARLLAEQVGRMQGLSVFVENRPGAANIIGTEAVSRAAPDGNTLLVIAAAFVVNPHVRKLSYDPFA